MKELELYIHIPFCVRKCDYCDFLSFSVDPQTKKNYVEHLSHEMLYYGIGRKMKETYRVSSIFIGGGTPSSIEGEQIAYLLNSIRKSFTLMDDAEISIECNPGTLSEEKLSIYKAAGINRLSIGLQSADNRELKLLGRIHSWEDFLNSYQMARKTGITNINIDLITSLPYQTRESFQTTLEKVISLEPEHISAYSLIIEPGTPFYERYEQDILLREEAKPTECLPDEDTEYEIGKITERILEENGYHRYEISNYAKDGKACRHNIGYWTGKEYLGLGLGASGYVDGIRYSNRSDLSEYLEYTEKLRDWNRIPACMETMEEIPLHDSYEKLTEKSKMEEFMFLGLRMTAGVSADEFEERFGQKLLSVYGETIAGLMEEGLMEERSVREKKENSIRYCLSGKGLDLANYCMSLFLL